ncbi:replication-associated protein [Pimoid spider associated circular virus 2]|uniref:replication-associated protein n=1 Tax=Pimoid spider associated circular virus 2 TaxID=2293298 RepID=UPI000E32FF82|nr:replication-associated protein [Pimoid spider associated circular virus 2]AXL65929.1 replication-associated protein [Pimoid spider associated circular virus 2]
MSCKNWCFTWNNPDLGYEALLELLSSKSSYCIFQKEQGANGTVHFQGFVQFTSKQRLSSLKKVLQSAHWERTKGTAEENRDYCSKADSRVDGPWSSGRIVVKGQRRDIEEFRDAVLEGSCNLDLVMSFPGQVARFPKFIDFVRSAQSVRRVEKPVVECFYGPSGSGKTRRAMAVSGFDSTFVVSRPDSGRPLWWDGFDPRIHITVVLDDFYGWIPWSFLLQLIDRYPFQVEKKGGKIEFNCKNVIFTSNQHPSKWYKSVPNDDLTPLLRRIDNIVLME